MLSLMGWKMGAVILMFYENGDSIQMEYQGGVVQNGILVTTDPNQKIFTLNNGVASSTAPISTLLTTVNQRIPQIPEWQNKGKAQNTNTI